MVTCFFPVTHAQYWYFTAYFCMFFFIPFFNLLIENLTNEKRKLLVVTIIVIFSVVQTGRGIDIFGTATGYSALWLGILYVIGGCIKKLELEKISGFCLGIIFFMCNIITWLFKIVVEIWQKNGGELRTKQFVDRVYVADNFDWQYNVTFDLR